MKEVHFQESNVYFRRVKEGKTKKNIGKMKVMEGTKSGRNFILKANYGGSKCHISKEHYGAYEAVVLYS